MASVKSFAKGFVNSAVSMGVRNWIPAVAAYEKGKQALSIAKDIYHGNYSSAKHKAYEATGIPAIVNTVKKAVKGDAEAAGSLSVAVVAVVATKGSVSATESAIAKSTTVLSSEAAAAESSASSSANSLNLNKQLASESQMTSEGKTIAGGESATPLRKAESLAAENGGEPGDWVKKTSESHTAPDGTKFETHWEENTQTGLRVNQKTKIETVTPKKETLN